MPNPPEKARVFPATKAYNAAVAEALPLADTQSFEDAKRGWLASFPKGGVKRADGGTAWDIDWFAFEDGPCPDSVNPSLWRHAQVNKIDGLFEVCDGVWQVRACDYSNMTVIRGETGWILVDTMVSNETSAAALGMVNKTLGERPVSAVLITHNHADHFSGIRGVIGPDPAKFPPIYAPDRFVVESAGEGIFAGNVMFRRAQYQFGVGLEPGPQGKVDGGIGKMPARGTRSFAPPSDDICETGETRIIDGVRFEFLMANGTEAEAEFTFFLPDFGVLCMAEVCTQTMHNLLPPRGAVVRDALLWSKVIDQALVMFGERTEALVNSHNWPVWGRADVGEYLAEQRDIYKYTHDQTLRLANLGYTPDEIAAEVQEPDWQATRFHARGYYGELGFNVRATYQKYLGYYDGRPVSLNPLPPVELGQNYVAAMGGVDAVVALARAAIDEDNLQWAATLLTHAVFGGHVTDEVRGLLADVYRNQGFRCESGIMRNVYLQGALEIENGVTPLKAVGTGRNPDLAKALELADWFDVIAIRLNPERARGVDMSLRLHVDGDRVARVSVNRQTETVRTGDDAMTGQVNATLHLTLEQLEELSEGRISLSDAMAQGMNVEGDPDVVQQWLDLHDSFDLWFNIVEP